MPNADLNSVGRFSDRVDDYVRYRPSYPPSLIAFLRERTGLGPAASVTDVGAGTGIFSRLLLETGARVVAVEPNDAMRAAAEADLAGRAGYASVKGTAEATGLADASATLITCAQAFHWFDPANARREFRRILAPGGWCALVWNTGKRQGEFAEGYEKIKATYGRDIKRIRHDDIAQTEGFRVFFGAGGWERRAFDNSQALAWDSLRGRLMSSSYAPKAGQPGHEPMLADLRELFDRCQRDGAVRMEYEAEVYLGPLT